VLLESLNEASEVGVRGAAETAMVGGEIGTKEGAAEGFGGLLVLVGELEDGFDQLGGEGKEGEGAGGGLRRERVSKRGRSRRGSADLPVLLILHFYCFFTRQFKQWLKSRGNL